MRITLHTEDNRSLTCLQPHDKARYVKVQTPDAEGNTIPCPHCAESPLPVYGCGQREQGHDYITEPARCAVCGESVGKLTVTFDTLFGLDEDEAVLHGRPRVY